jgi:thiopeptide-type bacteriocin biosynthesis protein
MEETSMAENWISIHIFYAGSPEPLLLEAIEPLVDTLRCRELIRRYFFIRYWQEGPHIRLRLLPAPGVEEEVKALVQERIEGYLQRHPSLYRSDGERLAAFYKQMFITEYSQEKWREVYGTRETMPVRPNNSLHFIAYEAEYERYGGPLGMEVAEWHFERSSDLIFKLMRSTNVHVRSIMLGLSLQLALPLCFALLEDEQAVITFLARYERFWTERYVQASGVTAAHYEKKFEKMASSLHQRVQHLARTTKGEGQGNITFFEQAWAAHARELKARLDPLIAARQLIFQNSLTNYHPKALDDRVFVYTLLLSSYIHMTNNRLGTMIPDEIYLAYLMRRALEENSVVHGVRDPHFVV